MTAKSNLPTGVIDRVPATEQTPEVTYRVAGDKYVILEYGEMTFDLSLNIRIHALKRTIDQENVMGIEETIPGVRTLMVSYDSLVLSPTELVEKLQDFEEMVPKAENISMPSRTVSLPISFDSEAIRDAIDKYKDVVREDAPNLPDNLEFLAQCNGLSVDEVKDKLLSTELLVVGLGDVFLGTPLLVPIDPRARMVVPKYDPARTWTPEGVVGWGGSTLCIYAAETPGGYQLLGRTIPVWDTNQKNSAFDEPWLFNYYDTVEFHEVSEDELKQAREEIRMGTYEYEVSETATFDFGEYLEFKESVAEEAAEFKTRRENAIEEIDMEA
jgi:urea carboxylase